MKSLKYIRYYVVIAGLAAYTLIARWLIDAGQLAQGVLVLGGIGSMVAYVFHLTKETPAAPIPTPAAPIPTPAAPIPTPDPPAPTPPAPSGS